MEPPPRVLAFVLAGGEGKRLFPLTRDRAKPAVPFGGVFRLIDFALSNLVNGGYRRIAVLTQYKSNSLNRHLALTWRLSPLLGGYVTPVPAQMRSGPHWYAGSADALFQNLNLVDDEQPEHLIVFGADHVYRMDPRQMVEHHLQSGAAVTVAAIRVPVEEASSFGVIEADALGRITAFREKPKQADPLPDDPFSVFASMGNYVFSTQALREAVIADAEDGQSAHDIGGNLIPRFVERGEAAGMTSRRIRSPGRATGSAATGVTSERSMPSTTHTWTSSRWLPCSTSTTRNGPSTRINRLCHPRSSSSKTRGEWGTRSTRWLRRA